MERLFQELEIVRYSASGEVVRRIRALAGRITVLRAAEDAVLDGYRAALRSATSSPHFSCSLDGKPFQVAEHIYIGAVVDGAFKTDGAVRDCLRSAGMTEADIEPCLIAHGLGGLSSKNCAELSPGQRIILGLLAATNLPNRVIILEDPFAHIDPQWREKLAERLTSFVKDRRGIVVVTRLDHRPQAWVENEYIARIQVERPRQATVGFGGQDSATTQLVENVRAEHRARSGVFGQGVVPSGTAYSFGSATGKRWSAAGRAGLGVGVILLWMFVMDPGSPLYQVRTNESAPIVRATVKDSSPAPARPKVVLDTFPIEIKEAVLLSFSNPEAAVRSGFNPVFPSGAAVPTMIEDSAPSFDGVDHNAVVEQPDYSNGREIAAFDAMEQERRREEVRQRFLESLQHPID